jgi:hypothetical protein
MLIEICYLAKKSISIYKKEKRNKTRKKMRQ